MAGFMAGKLLNRRGEVLPVELVVGVIGAVIGGWIFRAAGAAGVTGFNMWSLVVALAGSAVLLVAWRASLRPARRA
jgi:uncharacterized membrane protein YeaQ/YmgE (transglycosylase-associated protein family)